MSRMSSLNQAKKPKTKSAPPVLANINLLPEEILLLNIFVKFRHKHWLTCFSRVCKKWKRISEDPVVPKHLEIVGSGPKSLGKILLRVAKYRPTSITLCGQMDQYMIQRILAQAPRLETLILGRKNLRFSADWVELNLPLSSTTTLVFQNFSNNNLKPSLQTRIKRIHMDLEVEGMHRLKSLAQHADEVCIRHAICKYLCSTPDMSPGVIFSAPKLLYVGDDFIFKRANGVEAWLDPFTDLSYMEFFRFYGETKFISYLRKGKYRQAAKIFRTQTSWELEREYQETGFDYEYPYFPRNPQKFSKHYWNMLDCNVFNCHVVNEKAFKHLVATNILSLPADIMFCSSVEYGRPFKALKVFKNLKTTHLLTGWTFKAFFKLLDHHGIVTENLRHPKIIEAIKILSTWDGELWESLQAEKLDKISFLKLKWRQFLVDDKNPENFLRTALSRCRFDVHVFLRKATASLEWQQAFDQYARSSTKRMEKILRQEPLSNDIIAFMERCKITPLFETRGRSIFGNWIAQVRGKNERQEYEHFLTNLWRRTYAPKTFRSPTNSEIKFSNEEKQDPIAGHRLLLMNKFKEYVNFIDSNGDTPLSIAVDTLDCAQLKQFLSYTEPDPTIHRGDKMSPLAIAIERVVTRERKHNSFDLITALIEVGADINAPCIFQERMCSPLMIAVLLTASKNFVRQLIALGARLDYEDEKGRSVIKCLKDQDYSAEFRTELKFYKM